MPTVATSCWFDGSLDDALLSQGMYPDRVLNSVLKVEPENNTNCVVHNSFEFVVFRNHHDIHDKMVIITQA